MPDPVLRLDAVHRTYRQGDAQVEVLRGVNLTVQAGEAVALVAPSGAGKSTLLHICGLLERPTSGEITLAGTPCTRLSDAARSGLRHRTLGFVYQFHHLMPEFSALENVMLPQLIGGTPEATARADAAQLLETLGLAHRLTHRPGTLSGGEQQRVAIARALANRPALLLADEPTGNLDPHTADQVFALLLEQVRARRMAALIVTHNPALAARLDRVLTLQDGALAV